MTKIQLVDSLITSNATSWDESDREFLMVQDDDVLTKMQPVVNVNPGQSVDSGSDDNDQNDDAKGQVKAKKLGSKSGAAQNADDVDVSKKNPKQSAAEKTKDEEDATMNMSTEDYIANAPAGMREDQLCNAARLCTGGVCKRKVFKNKRSAVLKIFLGLPAAYEMGPGRCQINAFIKSESPFDIRWGCARIGEFYIGLKRSERICAMSVAIQFVLFKV